MQLNSLLCFRSVGRYPLVTVFFIVRLGMCYLTASVLTFPLNPPLEKGGLGPPSEEKWPSVFQKCRPLPFGDGLFYCEVKDVLFNCIHIYIPPKSPFDLWSSSFAPRHSLQAASALGLAPVGKGGLVALLPLNFCSRTTAIQLGGGLFFVSNLFGRGKRKNFNCIPILSYPILSYPILSYPILQKKDMPKHIPFRYYIN